MKTITIIDKYIPFVEWDKRYREESEGRKLDFNFTPGNRFQG